MAIEGPSLLLLPVGGRSKDPCHNLGRDFLKIPTNALESQSSPFCGSGSRGFGLWLT